MNISKNDRPAFVTFETRAEEDRQASIDAGHYVGKDVDYAIITPAGSKDRIERIVSEWLLQIADQVQQDRLPAEWARHYRESYKAWKEGQELPVEGTPIANWPVLSPSQVKTLQSLHVRSVEELAVANEETLNRIGMGARALKTRAEDWLKTSQEGKVAGELSAARQEAEDQKVYIQSLENRLKEMEAAFQSLKPPAPATKAQAGASKI